MSCRKRRKARVRPSRLAKQPARVVAARFMVSSFDCLSAPLTSGVFSLRRPLRCNALPEAPRRPSETSAAPIGGDAKTEKC
jgi:hypothetical protein